MGIGATIITGFVTEVQILKVNPEYEVEVLDEQEEGKQYFRMIGARVMEQIALVV